MRSVLSILLITLLATPAPGAEPGSDGDAASRVDATVRTFLDQHCVRCHGGEVQESDFRVDNLTADFLSRPAAAAWIEIRNRLNLGEMPPNDEPQPDPDSVVAVSRWIAGRLREAERAAVSRGGRNVLRRMNRQEYTNTVRDLLQMEFLPGESPADFLPPDGTVAGFNKVSVGLMIDPSLMEKYYKVARRIADRAIVSGPPEFPTETMHMEFEDTASNRAIDYLCDRPGFDCREDHIEVISGHTRSFGRMFYPGHRTATPVRGKYRISVKAGSRRGEDGEPVRMIVTQSHPDQAKRTVMEVDVEATPDEPRVYSVVVPRDSNGSNWHVEPARDIKFTNGSPIYIHYANRIIRKAGREGDFETAIRYRGKMLLEGGHNNSLLRPDRIETESLPMLHLDWIKVEGPLYEQWPPKSHELILFRGPDAEPSLEYVREIFTRLMPRAYRRPVKTSEIEPIVAFVEQELNEGRSFEEAIRSGLTAVLTSPHFLYLFERSQDDQQRSLTEWELATRLSYFLWSSCPDEQLRELAASGQLSNPHLLNEQVDRMLADPKIDGFVNGFGAQWLRTDTFLNFEPDARQYPDYDEHLGRAMIGETLAFFREILLEDLDLRNFIRSDFGMLNERLAAHYGIPGVEGDEFRRVSLPADSHRSGLLTQAGVLLAGSDGDRTKPVSRGVYVREVLFNDPPDPPPPNAGEIEPNIKGENLTVRERLIQHQQIESCARCHRTIDPYGLALENYDVIGNWRTRQNGEGFRANRAPPIDASGKLPNGETFETPEQLQRLLLAQDERFFRGLTEKTMLYALGRPIEPSDESTIEKITRQLKSGEPTMRTLIREIVTSRQFLKK